MAYLAGLLLNGLMIIGNILVVRALISIGVGIATYAGLSIALTWLKNLAIASLHGLPAEIFSLVSYVGVGSFISLIFSAFATRLILDGLVGDTLKKWVLG